ncbi:neocarzinostatin family protein [Streptomyces sp. SLBN-118]|uniref:neocarzinostatin apoprotein domain-containing protein n=1 Tax=Streptomyces sp. SLBN-118 TaxID=2768454 RepID=UPI00114E36B2|nr:neocarzinostatin family protein [Streptomyces sp. SLBN-118]
MYEADVPRHKADAAGVRGHAHGSGKGRGGGDSRPRPARTWAVLLALLPFLLLPLAPRAAAADAKPDVKLSQTQAGKGGDITVSGSGWRPNTLLMMLICGQAAPGKGVIGGTNACANADGRAVTTDAKGAFSKKMPVAEPPKPCPCVVHVAIVTGEQAVVDAPFVVAGHPTAPLPEPTVGGKLAVLAATRLEGDSGILVFFGAPPSRRLEFTVGNLGSEPVKDPVFQIGTAHGVFAPQWEEQQWRGTIAPGEKVLVKLPLQLSAGAHGDYEISVKYGSKVLAEQPWGVGRPWGVTVFWILLAVVVPAAVFRIGMAVVDRVRPGARPRGGGRHRTVSLRRPPNPGPRSTTTTTAALPWFTPDSAPSENRSTTKGHS